MLKPALIGAFLAMAAGCATTPDNRFVESATPAANHCIATGTHIASKQRNCPMPAGRSYSKEDVQGTGASTSAEALVKMDPAISVRVTHR